MSGPLSCSSNCSSRNSSDEGAIPSPFYTHLDDEWITKSISSSTSESELSELVVGKYNPILSERLENRNSFSKVPYDPVASDCVPTVLTDYTFFLKDSTDPCFLRSVYRTVPRNANQIPSSLPFSLIAHPFSVNNPDCVYNWEDGKELSIPYCTICGAYFSFHSNAIFSGSQWKCEFCDTCNNITDDFGCILQGVLMEKEKLTTSNLMKPSFDALLKEASAESSFLNIFLIDISRTSANTGFKRNIVEAINFTLTSDKYKAKFPKSRILFIGYDNALHFYRLSNQWVNETVLADLEEDEMVFHYDTSIDPSQNELDIVRILSHIQKSLNDKTNGCNALFSAVKVAAKLLEERQGKIHILGLDNAMRKGKLLVHTKMLMNYIEHLSLLENRRRQQSLQLYTQHLIEHGISIDLFVLENDSEIYDDLIEQLCLKTGGNYFFYLTSSSAQSTLKGDVLESLSGFIGTHVKIKVSSSKGLRVKQIKAGKVSDYPKDNTLIISAINSETAIYFEIQQTASILSQTASIQVLTFYRTVENSERVRCHHIRLPIVSSKKDVFSKADCETLVASMAKHAAYISTNQNLINLQNWFCKRIVDLLVEYGSQRGPDSEIYGYLPENLKSFPSYMMALMKSRVFISNPSKAGRNTFFNFKIKTGHVKVICMMIYPVIIPLHNMGFKSGFNDPNCQLNIPEPTAASSRCMKVNGIYLSFIQGKVYLWTHGGVSATSFRNFFTSDKGHFLIQQSNSHEYKSRFAIQIENICDYLTKITEVDFSRVHCISQQDNGETQTEILECSLGLVEDQLFNSMDLDQFQNSLKALAQEKSQNRGTFSSLNAIDMKSFFHKIRFQKQDIFKQIA
ncbi:Sec23/Sec24 beta-sandwich domain-containing protein [Schizosaccharomyces cryophilus OY26]|uniref:Sec23/Sec24 beta-sandwich domain-containing protein n=1 Tax=Schizosaccharomyces cryophilus (strain OY26 / ATCC MYA-4695 / CBS 11777 / NBRC 106824 / NRRL Y48691) TaxID=653667 RepID=S9VU04_SCHCR|nr:Sec23/Sec24 beta-sandwich domain-containing protein [Schizosaccharomyces cryophilus OY26]EPY49580.1 Sec23/Sec24 beta-sandwich domain-containing protein [Schizosaccharomyces cryophilus OY26]